MKTPSAPPPNMDYISLQRAKSFARKHGQVADSAGYSTVSTGSAHPPADVGHTPASDQAASNLGSPSLVVHSGPPPSSKPPDLDYIAVQRAQSFARKRTSEVQAASAAAALGGAAFMKEALAAAGGQNNIPPGPPKSLLAKHPSLLLRFRPAGKDATAPKRLECFAARAQSEQIRLLLEATRTPYDMHIHFFGESANPDEYRSRANQLGELPLYIGDELGKGNSICGMSAVMRHLSRHLHLAGADKDPASQAEVDQLWELSLEMLDNMQGFRGGSTSSDDGRFVKPGWWSLKRLEDNVHGADKWLAKKQAKAGMPVHFVGDTLTLADIGVLHSLSMLEEAHPGWLAGLKCEHLLKFLHSHESQPWAKEYCASPRSLPACPIDFDFNLLHADWHPRHYEYLSPMKEETAKAIA